jgi:hypothetical protein
MGALAPERPFTEVDGWAEYAQAMGELARLMAWFEIAFPDLRLQAPAGLGDEVAAIGFDALVVSFPVHVVGTRPKRGRGAVGGSLFVEPAFPTNRLAARGLLGARAYGLHSGFGGVLEGGGIAATDGSGAFVGGGPAFGDYSGMMSLVARRYFVFGDDRWDFTLELTITSGTLAILVGG